MMTHALFVKWIYLALCFLVPPSALGKGFAPYAPEPLEEATARYEQIAEDLALEVEANPIFGKGSERATAALALAVMRHESSLRAEVDDGRVRGDHGKSVCLMQVQTGIGQGKDPVLGKTGDELAKDRRLCFRAGLRILERSLRTCATLHGGDKLTGYASGRCGAGQAAARARWATFERVRGLPLPKEDES